MGRTGRLVLAYLLAVTLIVLTFSALPADVGRAIVPGATALAAAAAVLIGIRVYKPVSPVLEAWYQIATGLIAVAAANVVTGLGEFGVYDTVRPSLGDALMFLGYILFLGGLLGMVRTRLIGRNRRAGLLDAIIAATAASMLAWTYLVRPTVEITDGTTAVVITGIAYPVASLVLLTVAMPLWFVVRDTINVSARIVVLSMIVLVATNVAYGFAILADLPPPTPGVQASISFGWLSFFVLMGLAGLHPSMATRYEAAPDTEVELPSWKRFSVLILIAGVTPLIVMAGMRTEADSTDVATLVVGTLLIIGAVLVRMSDIQTELRGALMRERTLRSANDELVAAVDITQVRRILHETTAALLGANVDKVWLVEDPRVAGYEPPTERPGQVHVFTGPQDLRSTLSITDSAVMVVAELPTRTGTALAVVSASTKRPRPETLSSIDGLVQCAALAVDRVSLGELVLARQSEARLQRLLQDASDVVVVLDRRLIVRYVTPAVERVLERHPREVTGQPWLEHVRDEDREVLEEMIRRSNEGWPSRGEVQLVSRDGSTRHVEVAVSKVAENDGGGYTLACHDVTVRHDLTEQLTHQAFHDALTGLANRALFQNRLRHLVDRCRRTGGRFAVLFIDIDDFKTVNDSLGHAAGDTLLRTFSARLDDGLRRQDTAARLGGDEFAVLVEDVFDDAGLNEATTRLIEHLSEPVMLGGAEVPIGCSIGVALGGGGATDDDPDELMRNADLALYEAKAAGKGRAAMFAPSMHARVVDHLQMKAEMRRGLNQDEFVVQFQPLFTLDDASDVVGVEALVRWNHPTRGLLPPGDFVHLAEETGLVVALGRMVLQDSLAAAVRWHRIPGHEQLIVAVNLSGRQLIDDGVVEDVRHALEVSGVDPATVVLEITESILLPDGGITAERLIQLCDLGVRLYIDDFGTGYSSLAYLRDLPVAGIKLAREFVEVLPGTATESGLVRTIHDLAHTLGLDYVVAEGIETAEQREALIELGYTVGQGFYLARPTDDEGIRALLATTRGARATSDTVAPV